MKLRQAKKVIYTRATRRNWNYRWKTVVKACNRLNSQGTLEVSRKIRKKEESRNVELLLRRIKLDTV